MFTYVYYGRRLRHVCQYYPSESDKQMSGQWLETLRAASKLYNTSRSFQYLSSLRSKAFTLGASTSTWQIIPPLGYPLCKEMLPASGSTSSFLELKLSSVLVEW